LLALLFQLMGDKQTVDAALTLAQELLAVGLDIFPLSCVHALPELLAGLSPRGLSLVGRALAVLLAKSAEQSMDGIPAPECVAPDLCASCANNQLLLAMPCLLPRIVALLRLRAPPPGLWGHMLAQLPNTQGLVPQWPDESEHGWEALGEAPAPHMVVLLSPEQVPPALRELVTSNPAVIFPGLNAAPTMNLNTGQVQGSLHLAALQTALWSTLQADLLYVLWALMGGKTKQEAQKRLVGLGLLEVLQSMFDRLDWRPPAVPHHGHHGAGCSCSPQSCLQMQLLRTLQALCEKESDQISYHRLLLHPMMHPPKAASSKEAEGPVPQTSAAVPATDGVTSSTGAASSSENEAASSSVGELDAEVDEPNMDQHVPLGEPTPEEAPKDGLLYRILKLLLQQPPTSVYLLGLASCVHKWVQASTVAEQQLVARFPGFIEFVLQQLLCEETPPEPQLQVFFDLLAELLKFNPPLLLSVQSQLSGGPLGEARARLFIERLDSHVVDASIFVQCVALTLDAHSSPQRGRRALLALGLLPAEATADSDPASSSGEVCHEAAEAAIARPEVGSVAASTEASDDDTGVLEASATGVFAAHIREHRAKLTVQLMGAVRVSEVSVETMCVINAAIVFFLIAECHGERDQLMQQVLQTAEEGGSSPGVLDNFLKLLAFWGDVYHSHSCERRFLEFSSGIPFERWLNVVDLLKTDLQRSIEPS